MPLKTAEKMKQYRERIKADSVKREGYLEKERDRWKHQRETGKEKHIQELSHREQRRKSKMTTEAQRFRSRRRQQQKSADGETLQPISDPTVSSTLPQIMPTPVVQPASSARARGHSRVRRNRSKAYRRIASLETELQETKRIYERYRKRCQRLQKSKPDNDAENEQQVNASPKTNTKLMLHNQRVSTNVKRTLLFHNTLVAAMQEWLHTTKTNKDKQLVSKVFASKIIKNIGFWRAWHHWG